MWLKKQVEQNRSDRRRADSGVEDRLEPGWKMFPEVRRCNRNHAHPDRRRNDDKVQPSTGYGTAATPRPSTGSRPRMTRIAPPAVTTNRLLTPVMATRPTFCAKALWVNPLKIGDTNEAPMSARSPLPIRRRSTRVLTISPTARMSAVVSVRMTSTTMVIDSTPARVKTGAPKKNGSGTATIGPSATLEKSALPRTVATAVPMTIANRIESREMAGTLDRLRTITTSRVNPACTMFSIEPNVGSFE